MPLALTFPEFSAFPTAQSMSVSRLTISARIQLVLVIYFNRKNIHYSLYIFASVSTLQNWAELGKTKKYGGSFSTGQLYLTSPLHQFYFFFHFMIPEHKRRYPFCFSMPRDITVWLSKFSWLQIALFPSPRCCIPSCTDLPHSC